MSKKQIQLLLTGLMIIGVIGVFAKGYDTIKDLKENINTNNIMIDNLKESNLDLINTNDKLNENINNLKIENDKANNKSNELQHQIDEMMKEVSYNPNNIEELSGVTVYHMKKMLKNTELHSLSESFVNAEKKYNVNAIFLAGLVANESEWGKSELARLENNLTGYKAYNNRASRGAYYFESKDKCIDTTANLIENYYLDENGKWYNGKSIYGINVKYSQLDNGKPNPNWSKTINLISNGLVKKANK